MLSSRRLFQIVRARAYPRIWGMMREPEWLLFEIMIPTINLAAFVYLYRALNAPEEYIGFIVLGTVMTAYWLNVVWTMAIQLHWDKKEGALQLYVLSPAPLMAMLVGMSVGGFVMASLRAGMILIVGSILFSVHYNVNHLAGVLGIFILTIVALYGLGMTLSSVFLKWGREAWQLALSLHEPAFFLTGMNFPLIKLFNSAPGIVSAISAIIPISFGLDAMRQLLLPSNVPGVFSPGIEAAIVAALGVSFLVTAFFALRWMEWKARVDGSLSLRWQ